MVNPDYTILDIPPTVTFGNYAGMEFGANIKRFRKKLKWRQGDLAEALDVAQATITRWETGEREPSFDDLEKLAKALEVSVSDLFREGAGDPLPSEHELEQMIQSAMSELPVGVAFADYPHAVASSLHDRLRQFAASGGFRRTEEVSGKPGKVARSRGPTSRAASAAPRSS